MTFISILSIFAPTVFVGYYLVWSVTPLLHTPLKIGDAIRLAKGDAVVSERLTT